MSKIFTPNIIITKNYEYMRSFSEYRSVGDFASKATEDTLVFTGKQNKYVQSLEHSFNFGSSDSKIVLKLVDVDGNFENTFFNEGYMQKAISTQVDKFLKSELPLRAFGDTIQSFISTRVKLYIAYGVGDDLSNWSDPIIAYLYAVDIDVSNNGLRTYTYSFVPQVTNFFRPPPSKDETDINQLMDFELGAYNSYTSHTIEKTYEELRNPRPIISELLRAYLSKVTNIKPENIVLLLPAISKRAFEDKINYLQSKEKSDARKAWEEIKKNLKPSFLKFFNIKKEDPVESFLSFYKKIFKSIEVHNKPSSPDASKSPSEKNNENDSKNSDSYFVTISAETNRENESNPSKIPFPDWWSSINDVFLGISKINEEGSGFSIVNISFETNIKWLKLFKDHGIIKDEKEPVLIAGDRQLILDLIYRTNKDPSEVPKVNKGDFIEDVGKTVDEKLVVVEELIDALLDPEYAKDVYELTYRRKNNSSFKEQIYLDELHLTDNESYQKAAKSLNDISISFDIPIFVNNFRNANVLGYSLKNTENYFTAVSQQVKDTRLSYLYESLDSERVKLLLKKAGLNILDDPLKFSNLLVENAKDRIKGFIDENDLLKPISNNVGDTLSFFNTKRSFDDVKKFNESTGSLSEGKLGFLASLDKGIIDTANEVNSFIINYDQEFGDVERLEEGFVKDFNMFVKTASSYLSSLFKEGLYASSPKGKAATLPKRDIKLQFSLSDKSYTSYLNLMIQKLLLDNYTIDKKDILPLADLIITLNNIKKVSEDSAVNYRPGITGPGSNFILSRIHEYAKKYAVELNIKTIPFFQLSDARTINKPAYFLSKKLSPIAEKRFDKDSPDFELDFFTGEYRIIGFRHVINVSQCYSEFSLVKFGAAETI